MRSNMWQKISLVGVALAGLAFVPRAEALVAIGNGNYFIGFTDMEEVAPAGGFQLKIQRTYNSRSQYEGMFGYGWGSDYEAFLLPSVDGSVVIQESGGGDKTRFSPKEFSKSFLDEHIENLVAAYTKATKANAEKVKEFREKVSNDANERDEQSRNYGIMPQLPENTLLYSTQRGDKQVVKAVKGGYIRQYADGKGEFFLVKVDVADQGVDVAHKRILKGVFKVAKLVDPLRHATVIYTYNNKGQLETITDKSSQTIRLKFNEAGKVTEASDPRGGKATYQYCETNGVNYNTAKKCGRGDLVRTQDSSGAVYTYAYDSSHDLLRIGFPDKTAEEIAYWPLQSGSGGGVKSVKAQNGVLVEYGYWQDPKDKDEHYKTDVATTYPSGRKTEASYEYYEKRRADGSHYRYRMVSTIDGEQTNTIYNECCGQPLQITNGAGVTKFEYYAGTGLPKEKDTPTETVQWEYNEKFHGKITKVTVLDKTSKSVKSSVFAYDDANGQLLKARTSDGKGIAIMYDKEGRIATMVDQEKRKISFRYTSGSKPSEIIEEGVGSIQVSYDKAGNIKDVKSKGGRQIAISVAAAFQNLLEIIKPAGIQPI